MLADHSHITMEVIMEERSVDIVSQILLAQGICLQCQVFGIEVTQSSSVTLEITLLVLKMAALHRNFTCLDH